MSFVPVFIMYFQRFRKEKENKFSGSSAIGSETCIISDSTPDDYLDRKTIIVSQKAIIK